jgi:general secretion pathway protein D
MLAACASTNAQHSLAHEANSKSEAVGQSSSSPPAPVHVGDEAAGSVIVERGTGDFVKRPTPPPEAPPPPPPPLDEPRLDIMFDRAPVATVVQTLLGDVAHATVVIDPTVTGELTIRSQGQLTAEEVPGFLKKALKSIGVDLIEQGHNTYLLQPADKTTSGASPPSVYQPGVEMRSGLVIMGLRYVSAEDMSRLLKPFEKNGVVVQAETTREMLIMSGPPDQVQMLVSTAEMLDVDWLRGMSYGIVPLEYVDPESTVEQLKRLFGGEKGPVGTMVDFVPLKNRQAILILAKRPERLDEARNWIAELDRPMRGLSGIQVIRLQYADAKELAATLRGLLTGGGGEGAQTGSAAPAGPPSAPSAPPPPSAGPAGSGVSVGGMTLRGGFGPGLQASPATQAYGPAPGSPSQGEGPDQDLTAGTTRAGLPVQIMADVTHNALLVVADPSTFADIKAAVDVLDAPVPQVLIETTIAEVTLNNDLQFGIQWSFTTPGKIGLIGALTQGSTSTPTSIFPGLSLGYSGTWVQATLNTLASKTKVEVISSPIIVTLNNKTASLQVGDEVPIITASTANVTTNTPTIVNTVEYKDTGIILKITPRIGAGDVVNLDVSQEDSNVVQTSTSGIDSPTIEERQFDSTVSVINGQTVALGGLIQSTKTSTKAGVPFLNDIPLLGELAGRSDHTLQKTELLVFLTPRIIRTPADEAAATQDLERRLQDLHDSKFIAHASAPH